MMSLYPTELVLERRRRLINGSALALVGLFGIGLGLLVWEPITSWIQGEEGRDQAVVEQWIRQARIGQFSLGGLLANHEQSLHEDLPGDAKSASINLRRREIADFLQELGTPVSLTESGYLPLFPVVYRIEVQFPESTAEDPVIWDSGLPRAEAAAKTRRISMAGGRMVVAQVQLRAYQDRIVIEEEQVRRKTTLGIALIGLTGVGLAWVGLMGWRLDLERKARRRTREAALVAKSEELKQELGRQAEFLTSLNVVAGSYAHNLQNLLLPPARLVDECLEILHSGNPAHPKLKEVHRLLELVSDRVRQTLRALRRDPSPGPISLVDLGKLADSTVETWRDLASGKWHIDLVSEIDSTVHVAGQESHLEQVLENLIINARDAIFEKRNGMVEVAQTAREQESVESRCARIAEAMRWRGTIRVSVAKSPSGMPASLSVMDDGIGMDDQAAQNCLKAGFSTKKNQAIHQGSNSGVGLGLTFVANAAHRHGAIVRIDSKPGHGTSVTLSFPHPTQTPLPGRPLE